MNSIVNIQNAIKDYPLRKDHGARSTWRNPTNHQGRIPAIAGPSGSGKTLCLTDWMRRYTHRGIGRGREPKRRAVK